ncbi:MAG: DUF378 domain-containing protein [Patescibacteria group bacterium]
MKGKGLHMVTWILIIIGGLNWLLIGLFDWGIGEILGDSLSRIVYVLVGLSAVYELITHAKHCKYCGKDGMTTTM